MRRGLLTRWSVAFAVASGVAGCAPEGERLAQVPDVRIAETTTTTATTEAPTTTTSTTAAPATTTTTQRVATTTTTTAARAAASASCHPSYKGTCIPPDVSDADCAGGTGNGPWYVKEKNVRVVGEDEYGLDSDGDGVACER